jgi:hypothetical protein
VAFRGRHGLADGLELHGLEGEAPRIGAVGDDAVGIGRAGERAVDGERDPVAGFLQERLDDVALRPGAGPGATRRRRGGGTA